MTNEERFEKWWKENRNRVLAKYVRKELCEIAWLAALSASRYSIAREVYNEYMHTVDIDDAYTKWLSSKE